MLLAGCGLLVACNARETDAPPVKAPGASTQHGALSSRKDHQPNVQFHTAPKPLPAGAVTSDWSSFLGPTHNGVSPETKLLRAWPETGPTLVWEMKSGVGYAAPAVSGRQLVYFHRVGDEERIECVDAETGKHHWTFAYTSHYEDRYGFNNGPRSSPVIDDGRVYAHGAGGKLHCLDLNTGKIIWQRDTSAEYHVAQNHFGVGSTPLVEGDLLIVNVGAPGGPCVVAYDKKNGKEVWRAGDQWTASYASPIPQVVSGVRRLFVFAGGESRPAKGGLLAIDPADGSIHGRYPFRSRRYESVNAANPVIFNNQVFLTTAYRTGCVLLNISGEGFEPAWKSQSLRTEFATPIHHDGFLYGFDGGGRGSSALVCVNAKTGETVWRAQPVWEEKVKRNGKEETMSFGLNRGSLIRVDGRFLCLGEMGHLLWLDLSPNGYKELSRTRLFAANETFTAPVLSRGLLYVAQHTRDILNGDPPRLLCYDIRAGT